MAANARRPCRLPANHIHSTLLLWLWPPLPLLVIITHCHNVILVHIWMVCAHRAHHLRRAHRGDMIMIIELQFRRGINLCINIGWGVAFGQMHLILIDAQITVNLSEIHYLRHFVIAQHDCWPSRIATPAATTAAAVAVCLFLLPRVLLLRARNELKWTFPTCNSFWATLSICKCVFVPLWRALPKSRTQNVVHFRLCNVPDNQIIRSTV